jgi:hypothetical protein
MGLNLFSFKESSPFAFDQNCAKIVQNCAKLCETGVLVGDFFVGTLVFVNVRAILKNMFLA